MIFDIAVLMDQYKIETKKGEGTYSEVFTAVVRKSGRHVAIKIMKAQYDSVDKIKKDKEIQALKMLEGHPNIVRLHDVLYDEP